MGETDLRLVISLALVLIAALQIPLLLGRVPPNRVYGFRTPRTMRPEVWFPANAFAARAFLAACLAALVALWIVPADRAPDWYPVGVLVGAIAVATVACFLHLRRYR